MEREKFENFPMEELSDGVFSKPWKDIRKCLAESPAFRSLGYLKGHGKYNGAVLELSGCH